MDQIFINDLLIRGVIGISERERAQRQDILINIVMYGDIRQAGLSDDIHDCVNYRTVAKKTIAYVERATRYTVEALAADIARICLEEPGVMKVRVRVEKPGAVRFSRSVGVEIERNRPEGATQMHQAYISVGSNIHPKENVIQAIQKLRDCCLVNAVSTIWETEAVGTTGPRFLNAAVWLSTPLDKDDYTKKVLRAIEDALGRQRTEDKYAPRTIDLDLIVFDEQVLDPNLWRQEFLAIPFAELRPDLEEPGTERTLNQIAQVMKSTSTAIPRRDVTIPNQSSPAEE